ncbi:hypothetical protein GCM10027199_64610 [Amycolatopsis magusensis]
MFVAVRTPLLPGSAETYSAPQHATAPSDRVPPVFTDCDLTGAGFQATKAGGCDLRGSELAGTRGLLTLRGATLDTGQASAAAAGGSWSHFHPAAGKSVPSLSRHQPMASYS